MDALNDRDYPLVSSGEPVLRYGGSGQPADGSAVRSRWSADSLRTEAAWSYLDLEHRASGKWDSARSPTSSCGPVQNGEPRVVIDDRNRRTNRCPLVQLSSRRVEHGHSTNDRDHDNGSPAAPRIKAAIVRRGMAQVNSTYPGLGTAQRRAGRVGDSAGGTEVVLTRGWCACSRWDGSTSGKFIPVATNRRLRSHTSKNHAAPQNPS